MNIVVSPASVNERVEVSHLLQIHLRDLAQFTPRLKIEAGAYDYPCLDAYWSDKSRHAYLTRADSETAGFALIRQNPHARKKDWHVEIAEFFVRHRFRRQGIGRETVRVLREKHPGSWLISCHAKNADALAFWAEVVRIHSCVDIRVVRKGRARERVALRMPPDGGQRRQTAGRYASSCPV